MSAVLTSPEKLCGSCSKLRPAPGQSYCLLCKAAYMREWRKTHPMTEAQRVKDRARSYAGVYVKRGKLKREPCRWCGRLNSQMHHSNYSEPLKIEWLCQPCHKAHHLEGVQAPSVSIAPT